MVRAIMRIGGTVVGAGFGLVALWLFDDPILVGVVLAGVVAASAFAANWIGTIHAYGATVTAITCAVVVLPELVSPSHGMDLALSRVACTLLGVIAVTLVTFPFTPSRSHRRPSPDQANRLRRATLRGAVAFGFVLLGVALIVLVPRREILAMALGLAIFCSVGSMFDPRPFLSGLVPGTIAGVVAAVLFRAVVEVSNLSEGQTWALTALFLAGGSSLITHPRTKGVGIDANMSFLLLAEVGAVGHGWVAALTAGGGMVLAAIMSGGLMSRLYLRRV